MKKINLLGLGLCCALNSFAGTPGDLPDNSPWLVRARGIWVKPDASSTPISGIGGTVDRISSQVVPELDFSYFLTPNIAAELILGTARHSVQANNTALGTVDLGQVSHLPPTLTVQYHFLPERTISPYLGAGVNYTHFYDVNSGTVASNIDYSSSWGAALQAGVDYKIDQHWSLNLDVKKLYIKPDVRVTVPGNVLTTSVSIDPWVFGLGAGYRF